MKITNSILTLLGIASISFGGYQLIKLAKFNRDKKSEDEKSNFSGTKNLKTITFKLKNNTDNTQVEYLFDALRGQDNPNVSVSGNLEFFNRELTNIPKNVKKIEFRAKSNFSGIDGEEEKPAAEASTTDLQSAGTITADKPVVASSSADDGTAIAPSEKSDEAVAPTEDSADMPTVPEEITVEEEPIITETPQYNQAEAPFKIVCRDASGNANVQQYVPMVSATQFQSNITSVNFKDLVLDGICLMKYTMYPNAEVSIIVYYEDIKLSKLLKGNKN